MRNARDKGRGPGNPLDARCREFQATCRERGIRITPQRLAVYRALAGDTSHPTADALHARLAPRMPSLSLATVYRVLLSLEREGLIRRASTEDGAARFDANLGPHQHLTCSVCGRISDFEDPELSRLRLPRVSGHNFTARALDIRIVGTCRACAVRGDSGPTEP
jgi:Fur family peroxide stress response transcriptional regulator